MKRSTKVPTYVAMVTGIISILLAVVIFVLAEGMRRWYSGAFFAVIGVVLLTSAYRWRRVSNE